MANTQPVRQTLAITFALVGLGASAILLQHHAAIEVGKDPVFSGLCEITEHSDCDSVIASKWGKFLGVPTAMWGLAYFVGMTSWLIVVGRTSRSRGQWHTIVFLISLVATAACVWFDYIMFVQLDKWCPYCLTTHIAALLLMLTLLAMWPGKPSKPLPPGDPGLLDWPNLRQVVVVMLLTLTGSATAVGFYLGELRQAYADEYYAKWMEYESEYEAQFDKLMQQDYHAIPIGPDDSIRGDKNAPHTVVMFTDFQCSYCRALEYTLRQRMEDFPGKFRIVFKHFPMEQKCNPQIKRTLYRGTCVASAAAEAVRKLGGEAAFWQMHDELFDDPQGYASGPANWFHRTCEKLGFEYEPFEAQFHTTAVWSRIHEHVALGHELGIAGTPTMFFDGRKMAGWGDANLWRYMLNQDPVIPETQPAASAPASSPTTQPATR